MTSEIEKHFEEDYPDIYSQSAAVFEGSDDINIDFDISDPSWTVVKIHDNKTGNFIETMNAMIFMLKMTILMMKMITILMKRRNTKQ